MFSSKRYFLLTFGIGAMLNLIASVLMGVFVMLDVIVSIRCIARYLDCSYLLSITHPMPFFYLPFQESKAR